MKSYLNERGLRILKALDEVARPHAGPSRAQVALAWLMARPSITAPIASATNMAQLEDLVGSHAPEARRRGHQAARRRECVIVPPSPREAGRGSG